MSKLLEAASADHGSLVEIPTEFKKFIEELRYLADQVVYADETSFCCRVAE